MTQSALIVGAGGIVGSATAALLAEEGWRVAGLARRPPDLPGVTPVAADLLDPASLSQAFLDQAPSLVVIASWLRQPTEAENIRVNAAMVRNLLDALRPAGSVRHVALVTGLKHYLGPFEAYAKIKPDTPFREDQGRLEGLLRSGGGYSGGPAGQQRRPRRGEWKQGRWSVHARSFYRTWTLHLLGRNRQIRRVQRSCRSLAAG